MLKQPMASGTLAYPRKQTLCGGKWTTNRWKQCQRREWKLRKKLQNCSSWFKRVWLSESKARSVTVIMERAAAAALFVFTGPFYALALLRGLERNQWAVSWFYWIRKHKESQDPRLLREEHSEIPRRRKKFMILVILHFRVHRRYTL